MFLNKMRNFGDHKVLTTKIICRMKCSIVNYIKMQDLEERNRRSE